MNDPKSRHRHGPHILPQKPVPIGFGPKEITFRSTRAASGSRRYAKPTRTSSARVEKLMTDSKFHEKMSLGNLLTALRIISDACHHLDKEILQFFMIRSNVLQPPSYEGIHVQKGPSVWQQCSSLLSSFPLGGTATDAILLDDASDFLSSPWRSIPSFFFLSALLTSLPFPLLHSNLVSLNLFLIPFDRLLQHSMNMLILRTWGSRQRGMDEISTLLSFTFPQAGKPNPKYSLGPVPSRVRSSEFSDQS